jgi:hypothetical protein
MTMTIRILMVIALLLGAVACGSGGIDNGVSSQQNVGNQLEHGGSYGKDPGPQKN